MVHLKWTARLVVVHSAQQCRSPKHATRPCSAALCTRRSSKTSSHLSPKPLPLALPGATGTAKFFCTHIHFLARFLCLALTPHARLLTVGLFRQCSPALLQDSTATCMLEHEVRCLALWPANARSFLSVPPLPSLVVPSLVYSKENSSMN